MVCLLSEREQNVLILSAYYRNESKTILFGLKIIQGGSDESGILILFFLNDASQLKAEKDVKMFYPWQKYLAEQLENLQTIIEQSGVSLMRKAVMVNLTFNESF